mmetsp:Transcript_577/g.1686  ORF Transcript_577/g.1686 Transcript_577/m.1686 type:complete len:206 (+) Transcript_577:811-1428(+)
MQICIKINIILRGILERNVRKAHERLSSGLVVVLQVLKAILGKRYRNAIEVFRRVTERSVRLVLCHIHIVRIHKRGNQAEGLAIAVIALTVEKLKNLLQEATIIVGNTSSERIVQAEIIACIRRHPAIEAILLRSTTPKVPLTLPNSMIPSRIQHGREICEVLWQRKWRLGRTGRRNSVVAWISTGEERRPRWAAAAGIRKGLLE